MHHLFVWRSANQTNKITNPDNSRDRTDPISSGFLFRLEWEKEKRTQTGKLSYKKKISEMLTSPTDPTPTCDRHLGFGATA